MFSKTSDGVTKPSSADTEGKPLPKRDTSAQKASRLPGDNAGDKAPAPQVKSPSRG
jgi:hypothetical protein